MEAKPAEEVNPKFLAAQGTVAQRISKIPGFIAHELSVRYLTFFLRDLNDCRTCHAEEKILLAYVYTPSNLYRVRETETIELGFQPLHIEEGYHFIFMTRCNPCQNLNYQVISPTETLLEGLFEHLKQIMAHQGIDYSTINASRTFSPLEIVSLSTQRKNRLTRHSRRLV
ncbi:MAG: hypothetical protein ACE5OZ_07240 [Candidatus Heimdallarchaeota archaeon]